MTLKSWCGNMIWKNERRKAFSDSPSVELIIVASSVQRARDMMLERMGLPVPRSEFSKYLRRNSKTPLVEHCMSLGREGIWLRESISSTDISKLKEIAW